MAPNNSTQRDLANDVSFLVGVEQRLEALEEQIKLSGIAIELEVGTVVKLMGEIKNLILKDGIHDATTRC